MECFVDRDGQERGEPELPRPEQRQEQRQQQQAPEPASLGGQRRRRDAPVTSRREHLVTGGLFAGAMTATMLGARVRAEETPVYMDRCAVLGCMWLYVLVGGQASIHSSQITGTNRPV
jgi:hypothetical protein